MAKTLLHPSSKVQIDLLLKDMPQSLLVSGPVGIGLTGALDYLADGFDTYVQFIKPEKDDKVDLEKGVISVDSVRRLYDMTKTIETRRRLMVIDYAERMGHQAQNAFLKLLEEPGKNTHFMLLSHDISKLLPTTRSRTQHLELRPITLEQSNELLDELGVKDTQKRSQLLFMASGLPAELTRLASSEDYFAQRAQIMRDARQFLQGNLYERLKLAQTYKDSREQSLMLLDDAMKLLQRNIGEGRTDLILKIDELLKTRERIVANGNVRLQLAAAMV